MAEACAALDQVCRPPPVLAVVDDDPAVRHALSFAFETSGISVVAFADAEMALAAPQRHQWRCLVLDQKLPRMSGLELLAHLRAAGVTAPSILITTHPSHETRARADAAGVEIIEKPLLDNQLALKVRELMDGACR
ncbi:MAG: response regulator [Hyphomonadaceae bacterium]|nr:response regulator [Hyphomonadaceae bacterium]